MAAANFSDAHGCPCIKLMAGPDALVRYWRAETATLAKEENVGWKMHARHVSPCAQSLLRMPTRFFAQGTANTLAIWAAPFPTAHHASPKTVPALRSGSAPIAPANLCHPSPDNQHFLMRELPTKCRALAGRLRHVAQRHSYPVDQ